MKTEGTPGNVPLNDQLGPSAWLVEWKGGEHTYLQAFASEMTAVDKARIMGGTCVPLYDLTAAPVAIMDTRTALGLCAPTEADFPALYALQGRRVALVDLGA
jgi:hypothetical protein